MKQIITKRIRIYGIVQGVGFRPTVSRHADEAGIAGSVSNRGSYVEVIAQGEEDQIDRFLHLLKKRPPKRSVILKIDVKAADNADPLSERFDIVESIKEKGEIFVSPDIAICEDCLREMRDPSDKRYLHPFINCTSCGPRLTILDALPYDRKRTSMKEFPMCPECEREYYDPASRRFDAQPVCCNDCGPEVYVVGREERGADAIRYVRRILQDGGIAAVKGIGGFHLCCDASDEKAVSRLRQLKKRPVKPFAVMMRDESVVRRECILNEEQYEILTGHQKPILLLERRGGSVQDRPASVTGGNAVQPAACKDDAPRLCEAVAPGNPKVGVMLPYAPVQVLLFDYPDESRVSDMLVMTSGNVSGAPICRDDEEAVRELSGFCDCILSHNRRIRIRCDDSVMDFTGEGPYMIRRSRGYAPLPVMLSEMPGGRPADGNRDEHCTVLAVGGELKNTFCIGKDTLFYPSSYIGDLADVRSVRALRETIGRMETLLEVKPRVIACDLHPAYQSSALAEELARTCTLPVIRIQHHYAHIVSCMAENDYPEKVLGASFDGTGYGTDGTIWGGEILLADYEGFERIGSIQPFLHVGGDIASREGWRIAVSMLHSLEMDDLVQELSLCSAQEAKVICTMADRGINTTVSTSAGRLFDAVSAVLGICRISTYEGDASCSLQFAAEKWRKQNREAAAVVSGAAGTGRAEFTELSSVNDGRMILRTDRLFARIAEERINGTDAGYLAYLFHEVLARQIAAALTEGSRRTDIRTCALSGGVYQNTLLLERTKDLLEADGFRVLTHHLVPPNDGGICLGQAVAAMAIARQSALDKPFASMDS